MKLLFSNAWLRRKIASDPDVETDAGMTGPRFFIDHGVIHDRLTGKHVRSCDCMKPIEDGAEEACALLNKLNNANSAES